MRLFCVIVLLCGSYCADAQEDLNWLMKSKKIAPNSVVILDTVGINPNFFRVLGSNNKLINDSLYEIDYKTATLKLKSSLLISDSLTVEYLKYPEFLTKTYKQIDPSVIVNSNGMMNTIYQLSEPNDRGQKKPFDGLTTSGSISRGVTVGNNQNSVLNSDLDLQISGKLNDRVTLRASIQDANIPLQQSGYSQRLDEFDQVFIEAYTDQWSVRAGDIDLQNNQSYFAEFSKRVQGLLVTSKFQHSNSQTTAFVSGALVRGQFIRSQFIALEGNQGPYKLKGPNNELFVLIVSGSETVFVNGVALTRGANNDYIIDYNAGEITFNPTYPINSEMRITVDYQYSERNYSRFVGYVGGGYSSEKLKFGLSFYNENDLKNQSLQQNLNADQTTILSQAGDDRSLMIAPSAIREEFSENRILYKKEIIGGEEVFVFSNNPDDELYQVNFLLVGDQQGDYVLSSSNAIANIYEYVSPVSGQKQGNYAPIVQLVAPEKLQLAVLNGSYSPSKQTSFDFELVASQNDLNLFSEISDDDNDGIAGRIKWFQSVVESPTGWNVGFASNLDYIHEDFRTIQRLYNPEFNRDWNLENPSSNQIISDLGTQIYNTSELTFSNNKYGQINYEFEHLNFSDNFNGNRHTIKANMNNNDLKFNTNSSVLNSNSIRAKTKFTRSLSELRYDKGAVWPGVKYAMESNEIILRSNNRLDALSQRFSSYEGFVGVGDSTKVFVKFGYIHRVNDSVQNFDMKRVNQSDTYYINSRLIQSKTAELNLYANYRVFNSKTQEQSQQKALNSRVFYNQQLANNMVQWQTVFETNSGRLPQQDFTYVEVEPGQGTFVWFDYNNNGIQEVEEFEIAQFQDQATYIRVLLPNRIFVRTHQNRLSQSLTFDPIQWNNSTQKGQKFWSHFYNLTSFSIDRKDRNNGQDFNLNPFEAESDDQLGLQSNFRTQLFFNRGKQYYTMSYSFSKNKLKNTLSFGAISQNGYSHQFNFTHKIRSQWLINFQSNLDNNESISENFSLRDFNLDQILLTPKLSYLLNDNKRFDLFYQFQNKENRLQNQEVLNQHNFGIAAVFNQNQNSAFRAEFNYFSNEFTGNPSSPVAYQMMEGLQPGTNFTWSIVAQKKLTQYLDLNLNYFGRKTETSRAIHTGSIQLKAYF